MHAKHGMLSATLACISCNQTQESTCECTCALLRFAESVEVHDDAAGEHGGGGDKITQAVAAEAAGDTVGATSTAGFAVADEVRTLPMLCWSTIADLFGSGL